MNVILNHIETENISGISFMYQKWDYRCYFIRYIKHHTGEFTLMYTKCDYRRSCNWHIEHHIGERPLRYPLWFNPTKVLIHIRPYIFVKPIDVIFACCYWLVLYVVLLFINIYDQFPYVR